MPAIAAQLRAVVCQSSDAPLPPPRCPEMVRTGGPCSLAPPGSSARLRLPLCDLPIPPRGLLLFLVSSPLPAPSSR
eukprot:scaffold174116_cov23-Tisochrysis_lutea.AAC.1